jgi:Replication-relaxation
MRSVRQGIAATRQERLSGLNSSDRHVCELLWEQRVMTTVQLTTVAYDGRVEAARHRLVMLHRLDVVRRFRPPRLRDEGSAPFRYVLGPAGAEVLAHARGTTVRRLGYRIDHMMALAHSPRLAHMLGVNDVHASLMAAARARGTTLGWWSERQCASASGGGRWGALVHPDAVGRWCEDGVDECFFLEYDRGTEPAGRLAAKVDDYAELAAWTRQVLPVLVWLTGGERREQAVRRAVAEVRSPVVPVLTGRAIASLGPADAVWLPVESERRLTLRATLLAFVRRPEQGPAHAPFGTRPRW